MAAQVTSPARLDGSTPAIDEAYEKMRQREIGLSRMLMLYIGTGLAFMLLPGTFLGVWNLIKISSREMANTISPAWLQAHGHAQVFGWIGTFILGIGFHSIPRMRGGEPVAVRAARACWALWTAGVAMRWVTCVYGWEWRVLMPASAVLELAAFLIFFRNVSQHKPAKQNAEKKPNFETWAKIVIGATVGMLAAVVMNLVGCFRAALYSSTPAFTPGFDQSFLALITWGFLVLFVWGFSAKWLPVFLGLRETRERALVMAFLLAAAAVILDGAGAGKTGAVLALAGAMTAPLALRLFEKTARPAKVNGVHPSYPVFIRIAYAWAIVAAALGVWAAIVNEKGVWGASRHALTVGFLAAMVFAVGQRVLPAFSGMRLLFSPRLMFAALLLLNIGCALRVSSEVLAYQEYAAWAWKVLPISAFTELTAITLFAINLFTTFSRPPATQMIRIAMAKQNT